MQATQQHHEHLREDLPSHLLPAFDQAAADLSSGRSVLLLGAPDAGTTMMAIRLRDHLGEIPTVPKFNETQTVRRLCRLPESANPVPWRAPHHTCSPSAMLGGGRPVRPGEVSLAHGGLLFLGELPEFSVAILSAVKHVYRDAFVEVRRPAGRWAFPADFSLLGACCPCPCGWYGHTQRACSCPAPLIARYMGRIPEDMFDVTIKVPSKPSVGTGGRHPG